MRILYGLMAIWCWIVIAASIRMALTAPPQYGNPSDYYALALFTLYFAVFMTGASLVSEDTTRRDYDLMLLFWPIILALAVLLLPYIVLMVHLENRKTIKVNHPSTD